MATSHRFLVLPDLARPISSMTCFPSSLGVIRVAVLQINLGDLQIDRGLFASLVEGVLKSPGFFAVGGIEAVPFLRQGVEGVVDPAVSEFVTSKPRFNTLQGRGAGPGEGSP